MIHRAPFGSLERFVAVLIEHTAGRFPLWLTPDQAACTPHLDKYNDYAQQVRERLEATMCARSWTIVAKRLAARSATTK